VAGLAALLAVAAAALTWPRISVRDNGGANSPEADLPRPEEAGAWEETVSDVIEEAKAEAEADVAATPERARSAFQAMAGQKDLASRYPTDGSYAITHLMVQRLQKMGLKPGKVWAVGNGEALFARTKHVPRGYVTWGYHVAPTLTVRLADGRTQVTVIDPTLFTAPVPLEQWKRALMRRPDSPEPYITQSRPGEAPLWSDGKRLPGSGYWPGADPPGGPDAHAAATMKKYKPWEGKAPPKSFPEEKELSDR
jgi:hypothetical protein